MNNLNDNVTDWVNGFPTHSIDHSHSLFALQIPNKIRVYIVVKITKAQIRSINFYTHTDICDTYIAIRYADFAVLAPMYVSCHQLYTDAPVLDRSLTYFYIAFLLSSYVWQCCHLFGLGLFTW